MFANVSEIVRIRYPTTSEIAIQSRRKPFSHAYWVRGIRGGSSLVHGRLIEELCLNPRSKLGVELAQHRSVGKEKAMLSVADVETSIDGREYVIVCLHQWGVEADQ